MSRNIALVLAGGKGLRMNREMPKQFIDLNGVPLVVYALKKLSSSNLVDGIVIVCIETYVELMKKICNVYSISKIVDIVPGGITRHFSIRNGINYLAKKEKKDAVILIHNANMPLVTEKTIKTCLETVISNNMVATSVAKNNGYFYKLKDNDELEIGPDRKIMLSAKVPEAATLETMCLLYNDSSFFEKKYESYTTGMLGIIKNMKVVPVYCESTNFKITTEADYILAEKYLEMYERIN